MIDIGQNFISANQNTSLIICGLPEAEAIKSRHLSDGIFDLE